jgi:hypothetical protein
MHERSPKETAIDVILYERDPGIKRSSATCASCVETLYVCTNPRKRLDEKNLEELAAYVPGHISRILFRWFLWPRTPDGTSGLLVPVQQGT